MPIVPLGIGAYKRAGLPAVTLRNMYLEADKSGVSPDDTLRVQRPGLTAVQSYGSSAIRGLHRHVTTAGSERLVIAGSTLYSGTSNKGAVAGIGLATIVSTPFAALIRSDSKAWIYDGELAELSLPDGAPRAGAIQDVDQLNGYGLLLQPNGRFYWLVPGETEIDPLDYATAESLPDDGVAVRRLGDEAWIFGAQNVEIWQATGDANAPFQRAAGRNFERGCLYRDTVRRFDNTLVWVGDDAQVYRAVNVPQVISDPGITQAIRKATGACSAWTFGVDGHDFYVLRVPGQGTFAYDASTRQWSEFSTLGQPFWEPWVAYQEAGGIYAGSSLNGALWRVDPEAVMDAGTAIERVVSATVPIRGRPVRNDSASVGVTSTANAAIRLRYADGQDGFGDYDATTVLAPQDVATWWRLGSTDQPFRTLEISTTAEARVTFYGMVANEAWS